ncbi:carboxypeptidase regulatory-like domain-containing protein [Telmatobacter bradus]|uniref:TonB-dependent receptor n=1 Tax=Telmatobacter bradus TaxID=474953 RepID=UPI003B42BBBC
MEGEVHDKGGAVLSRAAVVLVSTKSGVQWRATTNDSGWYYLPGIPVGAYRLTISAPGFQNWQRPEVKIDVNAAVRADAVLQVGQDQQTVLVASNAVSLDTSGAQNGQVLDQQETSELPLNGRSFTDLLALQAGVAPLTSLSSATVQGLGQSVFSPSGGLNAGVLSINGQRESANGYIVNGANAEETGSMAAAVIPNLDSIDEFRILVGSFDAEYGRFSGGQINVVTRSGGNAIHGDVFEFLRNTDLDARNYFSTDRGKYQQNQFGGVLGGPIRKDHVFYFADFQQTRQVQGADTGLIPVPTADQRTGDFSDGSLTGCVSGSYLASLLSQKLGTTIAADDPYSPQSSGCITGRTPVFTSSVIPQSVWSAPGAALLQYIPSPNASEDEFSTSAYNSILDDTKEALRLDGKSRWGRFSGYAAIDRYTLNDPYPTAEGGASVPGFNAISEGSSQLFVFEHDRALGSRTYNQVHLSYTRVVNDMGKPQGGVGVSLASQGFETGANTLGIVVGEPASEGVENVAFNNYTIGVDPNEYKQVNNVYEVSEDLSLIWNRHAFKFGVHLDHDEINASPSAQLNGSFQFYGSETGSDFADFLLGVPSQYNQNALRPFYERENYVGAYAQDSWRFRSNLTLNYGLRWDRISPWWEKYNNAMTLVAGEQSQVFPTAPEGIVYPGDPGIPRTLASVANLDFAPRVGVAWTPHTSGDSRFDRILGQAGSTVVCLGFGIYYSAIPGETLGLISDNAPYGFTYTSPAPPLFAEPFRDAGTGNSEVQRFPAELAPLNVSRTNPDSDVDWSRFEPISAVPGYDPKNKTTYAEQYTFSIEHQFGKTTVANLTYAGNQAHRLLVLRAANPGDPALCLSLSQTSEVASGSSTCGLFGESTVYTTAAGATVNGTRTPLGPDFGSVSSQTTIGNSAYNSLQATLRTNAKYGEILAAYTWSKSFDQASNFGDQVNPNNPALSRALSSFNLQQNFVLSYVLRGSLPRTLRLPAHLRDGWEFGGISRFCSGFPVTLSNYSDTSLWGTQSNGVNNMPADEPSYSVGPLHLNHNPRNGSTYFNTALFSIPADGDPGNARRRFFAGPGMANYDMNLQKTVSVSHSLGLMIRLEAFNVFNHAQFFGPQSVNGDVTSTADFGQIVSAASPRLMQLATKIIF